MVDRHDNPGILHLGVPDGLPVNLAVGVLDSLEDTYNGLYAFTMLSAALTNLREHEYGYPEIARLTRQILNTVYGRYLEDFVTLDHRLAIYRVQINSPGFLEVLGSLNPLETIRNFLNDRHTRRQDREYRESAERRRLELENSILALDVIQREIDIARAMGATDDQLVPLLNQLLHRPASRLGTFQDQQIIEGGTVTISQTGKS